MDDNVKHEKARSAVLDRKATFIRAHDLDLTEEELAKCLGDAAPGSGDGDEQRSDVGCTNGGKRELVSLVGGEGSGAVIRKLVAIGLHEATDSSSRWSATGGTEKILKRRAKQSKKGRRPNGDGGAIVSGPWTEAAAGGEVLVWSSKCARPGHGSDYPVVRSRGIVPASAAAVVELVRDSGRVTEYNKFSIGREDRETLTSGAGGSLHCSEGRCPRLGVPGEAKIVSSRSQPPLTRRPLEFVTLFHARKLGAGDGVEADGDAYVTVGRSVWETAEGTDGGACGSATRCEILLSANLVRDVRTDDGREWCELTSVTHAVSPGGVPYFVGKQLGLVAAENYIKDIRALFEK